MNGEILPMFRRLAEAPSSLTIRLTLGHWSYWGKAHAPHQILKAGVIT